MKVIPLEELASEFVSSRTLSQSVCGLISNEMGLWHHFTILSNKFHVQCDKPSKELANLLLSVEFKWL